MSVVDYGRAMEKWFQEATRAAASDAHDTLMRSGGLEELYLYFTRGAIRFAEEKPEGYELAAPERCPRHLTKEQLILWTRERCKRLPCLPERIPS